MSKKEYFPDKFPKYTTGPAYIVPGKLVPDLFSTALQLAYFRFEDVFLTGMVTQSLDIDDSIFWNKKRNEKLDISKCVCIHKALSNDQFDLWRFTSIADIAKY